ncbi:hypothetical protein [Alicyclobacillus sp. SO9]|uniref:hypothetical protein n=1 Tax=Alicyclobacillus sp. SO9 TaxID=2665646 RepID=UPI0018E71F93|nr:hypothetical protein [Alicyclobacillus sp. SO9]QQE77695.1 hypothetical protein GI364_17405 [Alicyclobacillus sp. SO9]
MTPGEIASGLVAQIQTELTPSKDVPSQKQERMENELVYLSMFLIELNTYLIYQDNFKRTAVMEAFWSLMNQSGLNMDVVQKRLDAYTDAARTESKDETWQSIGKTFAWHCLAQDDNAIASLGARVARDISEQMQRFLKLTSVEL